MRIFNLIIAAFLCMQVSQGQVKSASLQASGLTCALCAKSIHQGLSSLYFVESVDVDLESSSFLVKFKADKTVDPALIKRKVEDAGFFIASLKLTANVDQNDLKNGNILELSGYAYHIAGSKSGQDNKEITLELIDEGFVNAKLYKKYLASSKLDCFRKKTNAVKSTEDSSTGFKQEFHVLVN